MLDSKHILSFVVFLTLVTTVFAQEDEMLHRNFSIAVGARHTRFMDEAFSHERSIYRGTSFQTGVGYQKMSSKYFFTSELLVSTGRASATIERPGATLVYVQLNGAYARRASNYKTFGTSNTFYVGGELMSSNHAIHNIDVLQEATIQSAHTFNFFVFQHTTLSDRNALQLSVSLPLVGFIKRSSLDGEANQELVKQYEENIISVLFKQSSFTTINPFRLPQVTASFVRHLGATADLLVKYQFQFVKNTEIPPITLYGNSLLIGLRINFNKQK